MAGLGYRRSAAAVVALLTSTFAGSFAVAGFAAPDLVINASNSGSVTIPDRGDGIPYPSTITVPPDRGVVTDVDVTLAGLDHPCISDLVVFLISPTGRRAIVTAAADNCAAGATPVTLTFDDEATGVLTGGALSSGRYKPVDNVYSDPAIPASLGVFDGAPASGPWGLYVHDYVAGNSGSLSGGWALDIDYNDTVSPTGSVVVDGGASRTKSPSVTLALNAGDRYPGTGVAQMRFSNDGAVWSAFQPFAATATWGFVPGNGKRTVYVQFADALGNLSAPDHDSIILDTTAPEARKPAPRTNSTGVSVRTKVSFVASEKLDASTVTRKTVRLTSAGKTVKARVTYSAGQKKVTLEPRKDLQPETTYRVKISRKVTDLAGNGFSAKRWTLTTR